MSEIAWGYVRLSQEGRDASIDQQKKQIRECANQNELTLETTRNDGENTSGFNGDREGYQQLRNAVSRGKVDAIISRDRARLSRDFDDRLSLLTELRENEVSWYVIEAGGKLGLQDVQQAGLECIHAAMDHIKKMAEIERSKAAMEERRQDGCYQGSPPLGLRFAEDKCHLEKHPEQWDTVEQVIEQRKAGVSMTTIAEEFDVSTATVSRIGSRGIDWYAQKLAEYGLE